MSVMKFSPPIFLLSLYCLVLPAAQAQTKQKLADLPDAARMLPKPPTFDSWSNRLDFLYHNVPLVMNQQTYRADTFFLAEGATLVQEQPRAKLRLGLYVEAKDDSGFTTKFDPDFEVDVSLPNLENSWKIFVKASENDELPGTDPTDRERGAQVGVRRQLDRYHINLDAGVKARWLPVAFAKAEWKPDWFAGKWKISPRQRGYYESDDGFGEVTSLSLLRWFGDRNGGIFQSVSAAKWTEKSNGVEWEQSVKVGRALSLLNEKQRGNANINSGDAKRGYGVRYSIFGHDDGASIIDRHRVTFLYRKPIHQDWLFMDILPELEWVNEDDWEIAPGIRVGIDALFWEGSEG